MQPKNFILFIPLYSVSRQALSLLTAEIDADVIIDTLMFRASLRVSAAVSYFCRLSATQSAAISRCRRRA